MNVFSLNLLFSCVLLLCVVSFKPCFSLIQNETLIKNYDPKIVGGELATFNGTKHIVSIRLKEFETKFGFGYGHICGGTVIGPKKVVTAAHCVYKEGNKQNALRSPDEFSLVMGTLDRTEKDNNTFITNITKIIPHESFSQIMENDIAIMILEKEIPENSTVIKPIALVEKKLKNGTKCRVDGWGSYKSGSAGTAQLLTVNITIIDIEKCKTTYFNNLTNGMLCAGDWDGGKDSCQGDSGGPLSCNNELVGVVSWGFGCAEPKFPGIYSDVYYFNKWIKTNSSDKITFNLFTIISIVILSYFV